MISELQMRWLLWALVVFVALRCLLSLSILLRDRLQDLLVQHVKKQQIEAQKRKRIIELREKIRAKKASIVESVVTEKKAA